MYPPLVDYHCHLDLYPNFESLISDCERSRIHTLTVTTTPKAWPRNIELTKNLEFVRTALGMHPQLILQIENELPIWEEYLFQAKFIGEVGLDAGPRFYNSFDVQKRVFNNIISQCSRIGNKILTVHAVRTASKILEVFEQYKLLDNNKVVLHWFSGSPYDAKKAIDMGCYFSVNLTMLSTPKGVALLNDIPKDRILTETDGPFTQRNGINQEPKDALYCVDRIASIWSFTPNETRDIIYQNLLHLETFN
ncbi:Qat anti-phage system TatD family nuclease QatD [Persicitalea jodogahamensis]|uniref:TatD family hydrolase n=1 Tax=Persicitalea jodogahamensis TaxID=402147 RepID=A0A8J3GBD4_9BACT|nr:Qat anti-phage system TatD family nuclease QatD [Persicitalea jodogahamensis]GHB86391.1 TatD family hydrolase [Persicitalea jodogahamensis]